MVSHLGDQVGFLFVLFVCLFVLCVCVCVCVYLSVHINLLVTSPVCIQSVSLSVVSCRFDVFCLSVVTVDGLSVSQSVDSFCWEENVAVWFKNIYLYLHQNTFIIQNGWAVQQARTTYIKYRSLWWWLIPRRWGFWEGWWSVLACWLVAVESQLFI